MENQDEQKESLSKQLEGSDADYAYPNQAENSDLSEELKGSDADYAASSDQISTESKNNTVSSDKNDKDELRRDAEEAGLS